MEKIIFQPLKKEKKPLNLNNSWPQIKHSHRYQLIRLALFTVECDAHAYIEKIPY